MKVPAPLRTTKICQENKETMSEWPSVNGNAVREINVHQETMTNSGTTPESCYHQELKPSDVNEDGKPNSDDPGDGKNYNNGKFEYGAEDSLDNDSEEAETAKKTMFLIDTTSRFRRAVKHFFLKLLSVNNTKLYFEKKKKMVHFFQSLFVNSFIPIMRHR